MKNGAQILLDCLKMEGVDIIFGYPGAKTLHVHDALLDEPDIRHILVRHEQGAAHAADGYARTTGKVGVCLTTSGPGATNLVTGIATAHMDSVPMVALTCQVATADIGNDAFQEADMIGITRPITKHNYLVIGRKGPGPGHPRGLPCRPHPPPRPGAGRPAERRAGGEDRSRDSRDGRPAGLQGDPASQPPAAETGGGDDQPGQAPARS